MFNIGEKLNKISKRLLPLILFMSALALHTTTAAFMEITVADKSGFFTEIIHTPAMLLFSNPFHQYTAMLVVNGALAALIPVAAYKIAARVGVEKPWQRVLVAVPAGIYPAVIVQTKFVSGDVFTLLFPCLTALLLLTVADIKNTVGKKFLTVLLALITASAVFAGEHMFMIILAAAVTILLQLFGTEKKIIPFFTFLISSVVFLTIILWVQNRFGISMQKIPPLSISLQFITRQLYLFAVSTWGLGILGLVLFLRNVKESSTINILSLFVYLSAIMSLFTDSLYGIIPLIFAAAICCICKYDIDLRAVLTSTIILGIIFTAFFVTQTVTNTDYVTISAVFCFMALFIVYVCCGGQYRADITSGTITGVAVFFCVYACTVTLPNERNRLIEENAPIYEVSKFVYNSSDAPPVIAPPEIAQLLQFLNQQADIKTQIGELENYFLISGEPYTIEAVGEKAILYELSQQE
jgi:hypothetical protein